ncbi:hypothetical protein DL96DRAFT_1614372 [Flagelloscypha sp. PMI_526]|nr:hypothetical protein DL96DRAFT_1614372 [Flagelloscypha sp. PMI_526]
MSNASSPERPNSELDAVRIPMPKWVPISMFAGVTVALGIPLVLVLRIRKQSGIPSSSSIMSLLRPGRSTGPPPIRRRAIGDSVAVPTSSIPPAPSISSSVQPSPENKANAALLTFSAFGIATAAVVSGAGLTVLGVKRWLGVENTEQFASHMRMQLSRHLPALTQRINRTFSSSLPPPPPEEVDSWTWESSETRLRNAYEKDGILGWINVAARELEVEGEVMKRKKKTEVSQAIS